MKRGIITIFICALCFWTLPAKATLITIAIEGVVDSVWDTGNYLEGKIKAGDVIVGTYTYESTVPDSNPSIYIGTYEHHSPLFGIILSFGGFVFQTDQDNVDFLVSVGNAGGTYSRDNYLICSYNNVPLPNGTTVGSISWQLDDSTGNALSDDILPITAPILDDWKSEVGLHIYGYRSTFHVSGTVTSAQIVPEPSMTILLGLGGLILQRKIMDKKVKH